MNILENQQLAESVDGTYIDLEAQILQNIAIVGIVCSSITTNCCGDTAGNYSIN